MKQRLIILALSLFILSCASHTAMEGGLTDGPYSRKYENGTLKESGLINMGKMQGAWKFYDPDGNLIAEGAYRNGELDNRDEYEIPALGRTGKWNYYHSNGKLWKTGLYKESFMTGTWQFYLEDGSLDGEGQYLRGDGSRLGRTGVPMRGRDGVWKFYFPDGSIRIYYEYLKGDLHGKALSYYESGNIKTESYYRYGDQDSVSIGWYDSGKPWFRGMFKNKKRDGVYNEWYENGQVKKTWNYVDGHPQGRQEAWFENGTPRSVREFDQGQASGMNKSWYENGNIKSSETFLAGEKTGKAEAWYENGQLQYAIDYVDGKIEGPFQILGPDGKLSTDSFVKMETSLGTLIIDLYEEQTPLHAENFKNIVRNNGFVGIYFHRVIPEFVVQGGDPLTRENDDRSDDGTGGLGENIKAEIGVPHLRGSIGAARDQNPEKSSSNSQFYICLTDLPRLDNEYTVFGEVLLGMEVADKIAVVETDENDNPIQHITILSTELGNSF